MKTVTLKQIGYVVTGDAFIYTSMPGQCGWIEMGRKAILGIVSKDKIVNCINDNRFGAKYIEKAVVHIGDLYENCYVEYNRTLHFGPRYCRKITKLGI